MGRVVISHTLELVFVEVIAPCCHFCGISTVRRVDCQSNGSTWLVSLPGRHSGQTLPRCRFHRRSWQKRKQVSAFGICKWNIHRYHRRGGSPHPYSKFYKQPHSHFQILVIDMCLCVSIIAPLKNLDPIPRAIFKPNFTPDLTFEV